MRAFLPLFLILFVIVGKSRAQCNAAFTISVNQATTMFQANDSSGHVRHVWKMGDGNYFFQPNGFHTYSTPGSYTVTHILIDSVNNCVDSVSQSISINFTVSCNASFTATRDSLTYNKYHFVSTSSLSGGFIQSYYWTINGQYINSLPAFFYNFPAGTYSVCLTINTSAGCSSVSCQTITITPTQACTWTASFASVAATSNPQQISFTASPSLNVLRYLWYFGDGHMSTQKAPVHNYYQAGTYNVRLYMVDTLTGCSDSANQTLQVHALPSDSCTALFTYTNIVGQTNQVSFTAVSNQTITSQTWYITALDSSYHTVLNATNPLHSFPDTGYYSVCLKITTDTGCERWYCNGILVTNPAGRIGNDLIISYPNPVNGTQLHLPVILEQPEKIRLTVLNANGTVVYTAEYGGTQGTNSITIPVGALQRGQYFVDIQYGSIRKKSIFQKL